MVAVNCSGCISFDRLMTLFYDTKWKEVLNGYIFTILFVIGGVGNVLNCCILLSNTMRSRTNMFLSGMAFADLSYFLAMFPINLVYIEAIGRRHLDYLNFVIRYHPTGLALANWQSAASIWLATGVATERLIAVRYPLKAKLYLSKRLIIVSIALIFVLTFLFCGVYHFFQRTSIPSHACAMVNNTCVASKVVLYHWNVVSPRKNYWQYMYVSYSIWTAVILQLFVPFLALIVLNVGLIVALRGSRAQLDALGNTSAKILAERTMSERRLTNTVVAILAVFLICNLPSCVVFLFELALKLNQRKHYTAISLTTNTLIALGKTLNFVTYCLSSLHFRRRLIEVLCQHPQIRNWILEKPHFAIRSARLKRRTIQFSLKSLQISRKSTATNCVRLDILDDNSSQDSFLSHPSCDRPKRSFLEASGASALACRPRLSKSSINKDISMIDV